MNNLALSFAQWLESQGYGTVNKNLYIGGAPADAPDACYWITASGGAPVKRNVSGEMQKHYEVQVYYRDTDEEVLYNTLFAIENLINSNLTIDLTDYTVIQISAANFPVDQDTDNNERAIGVLHAMILAYQNND